MEHQDLLPSLHHTCMLTTSIRLLLTCTKTKCTSSLCSTLRHARVAQCSMESFQIRSTPTLLLLPTHLRAHGEPTATLMMLSMELISTLALVIFSLSNGWKISRLQTLRLRLLKPNSRKFKSLLPNPTS